SVLGERRLVRDLLRVFCSRHSWLADVEERDVGLAFARELDGFPAAGRHGHDMVAQRLELAGEGEVVEGLIIGDQDAKRLGHCSKLLPAKRWTCDRATAGVSPPIMRTLKKEQARCPSSGEARHDLEVRPPC